MQPSCVVLSCLLLAAMPVSSCAMDNFQQVKNRYISSDAQLLDRQGVLLQTLRVDFKERKGEWIKLADISPAMQTALILTEDKRFYEHSGVDWSAVAAAAWGNLWNSKTRGASTLTMQLAGLLEADLKRDGARRNLWQKLNQTVIAQALEREWRKDQILEAYLNMVPFRGELSGIYAMSRTLFEKHPSGLDQVEAAIAVSLIRAPNAAPAVVAERACRLLQEQKLPQYCLNLEGQIRIAFSRNSASYQSGLSRSDRQPGAALHLARQLLSDKERSVRSTLSAALQRYARDTLVHQLAALKDRNVEDGAVVVLDNASGDVLAWIGSSGALSDAREVDGVTALRQAGSTLKPFLYEMAIEKKYITAASLIDDSPLSINTGYGLYIPQNYDKHFKGVVSARTALASSLNIPAVKMLVDVQPEPFFQRLQALGLGLKESGGFYGYSLALGGADVSLLSLTNAYRTLANLGNYSNVRTRLDKPLAPVSKVLQAPAAFIVGDMLSDRQARAITFGMENALSAKVWAAVKTGTSKDMRDNWCIGYTSRYTVGVWVGNASGAPMWDVSGVTGAAPVWQDIVRYLHRHDTPAQKRYRPAPPPGVEQTQISYSNQQEASRKEWFLTGTEQNRMTVGNQAWGAPKILYPFAGEVMALDPDIPPPNQRVKLRASVDTGFLIMDGEIISTPAKTKGKPEAEQSALWFPLPGKHKLSLLNEKGELLDQVAFEVRGAVLTPKKGMQRPQAVK